MTEIQRNSPNSPPLVIVNVKPMTNECIIMPNWRTRSKDKHYGQHITRNARRARVEKEKSRMEEPKGYRENGGAKINEKKK